MYSVSISFIYNIFKIVKPYISDLHSLSVSMYMIMYKEITSFTELNYWLIPTSNLPRTPLTWHSLLSDHYSVCTENPAFLTLFQRFGNNSVEILTPLLSSYFEPQDPLVDLEMCDLTRAATLQMNTAQPTSFIQQANCLLPCSSNQATPSPSQSATPIPEFTRLLTSKKHKPKVWSNVSNQPFH